MANQVNVSTTTNQVVVTPQSKKIVNVNSGNDTSLAINQGAANTVSISNNIVDTSLTSNTINIAPPPSNGITITDLSTTIAVSQTQTDTIQIASQGPQGPKGNTGDQGPQGPAQDTGSLLTTASYSNPNLTLTKGDGSTFSVGISTATPTLDEVLTEGKQSAVNNIILTSETPLNLTNLGGIITDTVVTYFSNNGLIGKRDIDPRVFDDTLINFSSSALPTDSSTAFNISFFYPSESNKIITNTPALTFTPDGLNSFLTVGSDLRGKTVIGANSITASIISASDTGSFGYMLLPNLPTSDPGVNGAVFRSGNDLKISTG